jgi:hypothetical protein
VFFPRFSFVNHGNQASYNQSLVVNRAAKFDYGSFGWAYVGVGNQCFGSSVDAMCAAIQAASLVSTKLGCYVLPEVIQTPNANYPDLKAIIDTNNWYLYKNGVSGTKTPNYDTNPNHLIANGTLYAPISAGGKYLEDASMEYFYKYRVAGTAGGSSQAIDKSSRISYFYHDNGALQFPTGGGASVNTTYQADYTRDGTPDYQQMVGPPSGATINQSYRDALARGVNWIKNNTSVLYIGNIASWGDPGGGGNSSGNQVGGTNVTGMDQVMHGGHMEGHMGLSWSPEKFSGFALAKSMYQFAFAHIGTPNIVMPALYWDSNGRDYENQVNNWVGARYQFCYALQDNGYPSISNNIAPYTQGNNDLTALNWLDEMAVQGSTNTATGESGFANGFKYLGTPLDPPWTTVTASAGTVYARRFTNGADTWVVFLNPKGNGTQTVTIATPYPGKSFKKIIGTQDATINSGATVASIVMNARTGWIGRLV